MVDKKALCLAALREVYSVGQSAVGLVVVKVVTLVAVRAET